VKLSERRCEIMFSCWSFRASLSRDYLACAFCLFPGELCMIMTKDSVEILHGYSFNSSSLPLDGCIILFLSIGTNDYGKFDGEFQKWEFFFFVFFLTVKLGSFIL